MNVKIYDISYPFNQLDKKYTKKVYASLENVEHKTRSYCRKENAADMSNPAHNILFL